MRMKDVKIADSNGRVCPKCGSRKTCVYADGVFDEIYYRKRKCPVCGKKWRTVEVEFWKGFGVMK